MRLRIVMIPLLATLVLGCSSAEPTGVASVMPASAAPSLMPSSSPGATPMPTGSAAHDPSPVPVTGEFEISNTSTDGAPVLLETVAVRLERIPTGGAGWAPVGAACVTDPRPPVQVDDSLAFTYSCAPAEVLGSDLRLRAVVEATIAGTDERFRIETQIQP